MGWISLYVVAVRLISKFIQFSFLLDFFLPSTFASLSSLYYPKKTALPNWKEWEHFSNKRSRFRSMCEHMCLYSQGQFNSIALLCDDIENYVVDDVRTTTQQQWQTYNEIFPIIINRRVLAVVVGEKNQWKMHKFFAKFNEVNKFPH